ncbi:MAG: sulfatase [Myxococcota bacterium]
MSIARYALNGGWAGLIAGASIGLLEGLWILAKAPQYGADAPLYGVVFYGLLTAPIGLGLGVLVALITVYRPTNYLPTSPDYAGGLMAWWLTSGLALVILRFRLLRDLFHERIPLMSWGGLAFHGSLLLGGWILVVLGERLFNPNRGQAAQQPPTHRWPWVAALITLGLLLLAAPWLALAPTTHTSPSSTTGTPHPEAPPILLIMVDTLRADRLTPYGYPHNTSPTLAAFARDAVLFERAFAQASWTRPSVASLLTGQPPSEHRTIHKDDALPDHLVTLAEHLQQHRHPTAALVTNTNLAPYFNLQQGFDTYRYLEPSRLLWATYGATSLSLYRLCRHLIGRLLPQTADAPERHYWDAQRTTDAAIDLIDQTWVQPDGAPLLFLTYMDPHDPYFAHPDRSHSIARVRNPNPDRAMAQHLSQLYDQEIAYWDRHLARLLDHLRRRDLYDQTLIVITSDHGEEFQEHGGWWHGTTLYEEQIHVPLLIKLPHQQRAATRSTALARLLDLPPTLAAVAHLPPHPSWPGRDLLGTTPPPDAVLSEVDHQGNQLRAVRTPTWKWIESNTDNPRGLDPTELYDLSADPNEQHNIAPQHPQKLQQLQTYWP